MSREHPGTVFRAQCNRRPFLTRIGYIGIGPADTEVGNMVYLFDGG